MKLVSPSFDPHRKGRGSQTFTFFFQTIGLNRSPLGDVRVEKGNWEERKETWEERKEPE